MPQNNPQHSEDARGDVILYEFVDQAHPVTEEERNRPRYGRPDRKANQSTEPPKADPEAPLSSTE